MISAQTARTVAQILKTVMEEGTGKTARLPGYESAGKTGTAQKALANGRGYSTSGSDRSSGLPRRITRRW